jgi:hypothetical protein
MRPLACLLLLFALTVCSPEPGTPFGVSATAEVRARFESICVDPVTGVNELDVVNISPIFQSKGGGCMVVLYVDPVTSAIEGLQLIVDDPPGDIRARIETIILPIVNDDMRRLIQKEVFADLGVDKDIKIKRKGKGFLDYKHETHMPGYHSAIIRLGWH